MGIMELLTALPLTNTEKTADDRINHDGEVFRVLVAVDNAMSDVSNYLSQAEPGGATDAWTVNRMMQVIPDNFGLWSASDGYRIWAVWLSEEIFLDEGVVLHPIAWWVNGLPAMVITAHGAQMGYGLIDGTLFELTELHNVYDNWGNPNRSNMAGWLKALTYGNSSAAGPNVKGDFPIPAIFASREQNCPSIIREKVTTALSRYAERSFSLGGSPVTDAIVNSELAMALVRIRRDVTRANDRFIDLQVGEGNGMDLPYNVHYVGVNGAHPASLSYLSRLEAAFAV